MSKSDNIRYAIIPAAAITDRRLTPRDLQVLCLLGRHANDNGWCRRSQVKMAEELGTGRATIQRAVENLVKTGYVEQREEGRGNVKPQPGKQPFAAYSYRVRLDLKDKEIQDAMEGGAHERAPGDSDEEGVPKNGQGVPTQVGTGVPISRAPLTEHTPSKHPPCEHPSASRPKQASPQAALPGMGEPEIDQAEQSPSFIELQTNIPRERFVVTEIDVAQYAELYPAVDVQQQLRAMKGWLIGNQAKRKTMRGMPAFINGWLAREQDRGPRNGASTANNGSKNGKPSNHANHLEGLARLVDDADRSAEDVPERGQLALADRSDGRSDTSSGGPH